MMKQQITTFFEAPIVKFGAVLSIGLLLSAFFVAGAISSRNNDESISTAGSASKIIEADQAILRIGLSRQGKNMKEVFAALSHDQAAVKTFLTKNKIEETNISLNSPYTSTLYSKNGQGYDTNTIEGYRMSQTIVVESKDAKAVEGLSQRILELATQGVTIDSSNAEYYYSKLDDLKVDMLKEATKNALARARGIAESSGRSIGVLKSAGAGVFQITPKNSTEVSDYGTYDTSTREKKVTSVVNVVFSVR